SRPRNGWLEVSWAGWAAFRTENERDDSVTDELRLYDYELPTELIARHPPARREDARLLVLRRAAGTIEHRRIEELPQLLAAGDGLVLNDTRVLRARLVGYRQATGGRWEGLFLGSAPDGAWRLIGQTRGKLRPGEELVITPAHDPESKDELPLELLACDDEGTWTARPQREEDAQELLDRFGTVPLPPYLERSLADPADFERYQTIFAREAGSVAAPTAGLHFTPELLENCRRAGIDTGFVTLHVGIGTFRPITTRKLDEHRMHTEWCELSKATAAQLRAVRQRGGNVVAVGTTSLRTLESAWIARQNDGAWRGTTDLFIRPPYRFRAVDALLTNFHLPRSTLLVLVCTLAGRDLLLEAYARAVRERYRFFSYGDAMLIL
ncbi:MAG: tRNA preQ1(34) S-adenosylmethionine ribosyltransferase-isomerase QueA, partial [Planctomycetales bacterium]